MKLKQLLKKFGISLTITITSNKIIKEFTSWLRPAKANYERTKVR